MNARKLRRRAALVCGVIALLSVLSPSSAKKRPDNCRDATIVGTQGSDVIEGTDRVDVIRALGGNDSIDGLDGNDRICGGSGNDTIKGHRGNDTIRGGMGNDMLNGGRAWDTGYAHKGVDECIRLEVYNGCN